MYKEGVLIPYTSSFDSWKSLIHKTVIDYSDQNFDFRTLLEHCVDDAAASQPNAAQSVQGAEESRDLRNQQRTDENGGARCRSGTGAQLGKGAEMVGGACTSTVAPSSSQETVAQTRGDDNQADESQ